MKKCLVFLAIASLAAPIFAADISGKWIAQITSPSGSQSERIFNFTVAGERLTGTIVNQSVAPASFEEKGKPIISGILRTQTGLPQEISEGKISGSDVSFKVSGMMMGNKVTTVYTGKVSGNEIEFTLENQFPPGVTPPGPPGGQPPQPQKIVAKKVQ
jgi:hypothetical protein